MKDTRVLVAAAIRAARRAHGLSQEQLAERIDVAAEHLSALERGINAPSLDTFTALVRVLNLDAQRLLASPQQLHSVDKERQRLEAEILALSNLLPLATLRELLAIGQVLAKREK